MEAPLLVQVRGEAERLLGASEPEVPYWWTEARATTGVKEAEALAGTFVGRIATLVGGTAWPRGVATSIGVVNTEGMTAVPVPAAAQPAVDVLTDKVAVVIQDRPVVAMTSWLADTFRAAAEAELGLQIVTPAGTRLSPTVRGALPGWPSRWVVQDEKCGYYDGLSGAILQWANGLFVTLESPDATAEDPRTPIAETFAQGAADTGERQLAISFRCVHPADDRLVLGGAVESVWREITGEPPAGWGTEEPANLPGRCASSPTWRSSGRRNRRGWSWSAPRSGPASRRCGSPGRRRASRRTSRWRSATAPPRAPDRGGAEGRGGAGHPPRPPVDAGPGPQGPARPLRPAALRGPGRAVRLRARG